MNFESIEPKADEVSMSGSTSSVAALSEEQSHQLEAIRDEIEPLRVSGEVKKALASLNSILSNVPQEETYALLRGALVALRADVHLDADQPGRALEEAEQALQAGWCTAQA